MWVLCSHTPGEGKRTHDETLDVARRGFGHVENGQAEAHDERLVDVGLEDCIDEDGHREDV